MTFDTIRCAIDQRGVARVTLARSEKHNALSATMIGELTAVAGRLATDASIRAVILDAEGKSFCAGGDLDWMRQQFSADRPTRIAEATRLAMMLKALNDLPKPLIARVHGNAFGGGVGLISVCDTVIAASGAQFGLTETRLGLIPATISPYVIARTGEARARPLFMSARVFGAEEAKVAGFVTTVVDGTMLDGAVEAAVTAYLVAAPGAAGRAKRLARSLGLPITDAVIAATIEQLADTWETDEAREGVSAFFERRNPPWRQ
ncbi:crotonase/enoyl-CoA hydratase family protein [Sinorhizobium meliloti]|uniref:crotonase/enoyl-CoA hydratase family protein n=1 Tax=Rhizobium meliloti TaxID=382 RepID=UPI000FD346B1|nr:crotonase/enoyl-CoA hydratase family protein [Sinorhizobium meliloti]RVL50402.1 crotonase/enoyl-CoA hydratase family protein [Sinorhizobium meliloti]RVL69295.1 crotonase/enoyl-CoA hydratase family protein [Sinorhizobium meliloti]RVP54433.1 crotonase/enoyl-CoA hydratase family protein [Sinorhizobium meliloti]RVP85601.1 crotonase/enoyl-CoA hydratase family protein [Sinorhizobium meliloti]WQO79183.1 crotonase/enoyl-CoA hydratase family protein [Sinorhizobium meliloti]